MAEDQDNAQKTEEPTQKRIEDAIKQGNIAFSKEVTSFLMLSLLTVFIVWLSPALMKSAKLSLSHYITQPHEIEINLDGEDAVHLATSIFADIGMLLFIPFIICIIGAFLGSFLQNGIIFAPEAIMPNLSKISPLAGFKRIFSSRSIVELIKGILKISLVSTVVYMTIKSDLDHISMLFELNFFGILSNLLSIITKSLLAICAVMGVIAVLDLLYQRMEYIKSLRMTKQEVKEEMKQTDGNPEIKSKLRSLRIERARKRMMAAVPKADVIITNPTHYSIALKYDKTRMPAPQVVAKGVDKVALRIRELAKKHKVPLVENKLLARSIFESVDLEDFIHVEHYEAVAKIISKVMNISK